MTVREGTAPRVGDFVKIASGPGYGAKGRVIDVAGGVVVVKVASGGEWCFNAVDCQVLRKEDRA